MNKDTENLKHFITVFKSLSAMESAYIELEEFDVPYDFSKFFHDFINLGTQLERTVNINNLTKDKLEKYKQLNIDIFKRLKSDYPQLYQLSCSLEGVLEEGYIEAEKAIEEIFEPYENKRRPLFMCGFSSFDLYIYEFSLTGMFLKMCDIEDHFSYKNGYLNLNTGSFSKEFNLTGQEYQIYDAAYRACMDVLNNSLHFNGTVSCSID